MGVDHERATQSGCGHRMHLWFEGIPIEGQPYGFDSFYSPKFVEMYLQENDSVSLFDELSENGEFVNREVPEMAYRGNMLKRQKFFLVEDPKRVSKPHEPPIVLRKYTYPGWQWASMLHYRGIHTLPCVDRMVARFNQSLEYDLCDKDDTDPETPKSTPRINHVIGTLYEDGQDTIGWHNDKMKDIQPESLILIISSGEARELWLRPNPTKDDPNPPAISLVMESGSLFVLVSNGSCLG
eukprot:c12470_g1_i3.p1 GENE.c12470_g1_i3~~c12470_g1_i3.p1  ORF type:complete len:239 (+),score=30.96 c12470_g1_i3:10-726(+)